MVFLMNILNYTILLLWIWMATFFAN